MNTAFYGFIILSFIAVILLIEGIYLWWHARHSAAARRVKHRMRAMAGRAQDDTEQSSILKDRLSVGSNLIERILLRMPRIAKINLLLEQSGLGWPITKLLSISGIVVVVAALAGIALRLPGLIILPLMGLGGALPFLIVVRHRTKRLVQLERQLPEAADFICRALRAGHSFSTALDMVGEEMRDPIGQEFRATFDEINFGVAMNDALMNLATRVPIDDLRYLVIAVLIQRECGGNLAELLGNISMIIRDRLKLLGQVRVLSAEGKMSAWILGLLPFATGLLIMLVNPGFLKVLFTDPVGIKMVTAALITMCLGLLWMRKIIRIRV